MPLATPQGTLDFKSVDTITFVGASSNTVIDTTTGSFGVGVDGNGPMSNLHVVGNAHVSTDLTVTGNVVCSVSDTTVAYKYFDAETPVYTFSGLDMKVGEAYQIIWHYHNSVAAVHNVDMYVNGDETTANYWHATQYVITTFAVAGEAHQAAKMFKTGANADHVAVYDLRLSWDGYPTMMGHGRFNTPGTMTAPANESFRLGIWVHDAQTSAITSLKFDATTGNIGVGSSIRILKSM